MLSLQLYSCPVPRSSVGAEDSTSGPVFVQLAPNQLDHVLAPPPQYLLNKTGVQSD